MLNIFLNIENSKIESVNILQTTEFMYQYELKLLYRAFSGYALHSPQFQLMVHQTEAVMRSTKIH